jgi:HEAT repeat protein
MAWRILPLLLLASLLMTPGCKKDCKPGQDADCWMSALKDAEQAEKAVDNLKQIGDKKAEGALIEVFQASTTTPEVREKLADLFKKWESKAAVKPMIEALDFNVGPNKDGKKAKRTNRANQKIASALGTIGDPSAVQPLLRLLKATKEANVQRSAIRALAALKAKDAVDDLIKFSEDSQANKVIRMNAVYALGEIGDPKALPLLVLALYMEKAHFFQQAQLALVKIGEPAIDLLVKTMNGESPDAKKITEGNVEILAGALEANAAQVLGNIRSPLAVEALLKITEKIGKWEEETNRLMALTRVFSALGTIGDARAIKSIMPYLEKEYWDVRLVCATALNTISDRSVLPEVIKIIEKGGDPRTRTSLIELIGNLGTDEQLPKLKEMANAIKEVTVTPVIQDAIKRLEAYAQCKQDASCWMGKVGDKDAPVREKAAYELGRIGDAKAVDALLKAIGDDSENVRYALIWAFDKLASKKAVQPIQDQIDKEKGSRRFGVVNYNYQLLLARLSRTGK